MPSEKTKKEEENSLLQSEQEQSLKHKIHQVVLKTQSHITGEMMGWGVTRRPCKRF